MSSNTPNYIGNLFLLSFSILFIYLCFLWAPVVPHNYDDYYLFFNDFDELYLQKTSFSDKIEGLLTKRAQHPNLAKRSLAVISYQLFGCINLKFITLMSYLTLMPFLYLLARSIYLKGSNWLLLLPAAALLFVPIPTSITWVTASMSALFKFMPFLVFYWLSRKRFTWALILAVLTSLSTGAGVFTFISGFLILFLKKYSYKYYAFWFVSMIVILIIIKNLPGGIEVISQGLLHSLLSHPLDVIRFEFAFLGLPFAFLLKGNVDYIWVINFTALIGLGSLVLVFILVYKKWDKILMINFTYK